MNLEADPCVPVGGVRYNDVVDLVVVGELSEPPPGIFGPGLWCPGVLPPGGNHHRLDTEPLCQRRSADRDRKDRNEARRATAVSLDRLQEILDLVDLGAERSDEGCGERPPVPDRHVGQRRCCGLDVDRVDRAGGPAQLSDSTHVGCVPEPLGHEVTGLLYMGTPALRIVAQGTDGLDGGMGRGVQAGLAEDWLEMRRHYGGHSDGERFKDRSSERLGEIWMMEVDERIESGEELDRLYRPECRHLPGVRDGPKDVGDRVGAAKHPYPDGPVDRVGSPQLLGVVRPLQSIRPTVPTDDEPSVVRRLAPNGRFLRDIDDLDPGAPGYLDVRRIAAER